MNTFATYSLRLGGRLKVIDRPQVMGIINATPDSFYAGSRTLDVSAIESRVEDMIAQGADMIDVGAYSSRPGASDVSEQEETDRLATALSAIRRVAPDIPVSVDTFRSAVARVAVEQMGADIINDISGGDLDDEMFATVAQLDVPYILMHMRGTPATMQDNTDYDNVVNAVTVDLAQKAGRLRQLGVSDLIIDPGFGFSKTVSQSFEILRNLSLMREVLAMPMLVGVSRKSMIYKTLGCTPDEALNGTTVVNTMALLAGASILRVHDVRQAAEAVKLVEKITN